MAKEKLHMTATTTPRQKSNLNMFFRLRTERVLLPPAAAAAAMATEHEEARLQSPACAATLLQRNRRFCQTAGEENQRRRMTHDAAATMPHYRRPLRTSATGGCFRPQMQLVNEGWRRWSIGPWNGVFESQGRREV
ncbi:uncharacterized protein LOC144040760 [Vanacampus margaritifer]